MFKTIALQDMIQFLTKILAKIWGRILAKVLAKIAHERGMYVINLGCPKKIT